MPDDVQFKTKIDLALGMLERAVCAEFAPAAARQGSRPSAPHRGLERRFSDSFITIWLAIARVLVRRLPRCPICHRAHSLPPLRATFRKARGFRQEC